MGAYVTVFTTSAHKIKAAKDLGDTDVIISTGDKAMKSI
jgi:D-arabinose 1-dehydrogenase-like Zn-dependent alcohol dehydrogenase